MNFWVLKFRWVLLAALLFLQTLSTQAEDVSTTTLSTKAEDTQTTIKCYHCWYYDTTRLDRKTWTDFFQHHKDWDFSDDKKWEGCAPRDDGSDSELWKREADAKYLSNCPYNGPGACIKDFAENSEGDYFVIRRCANSKDEERLHLNLNPHVGRVCREGTTLEKKERSGIEGVYVSCMSAKDKSNDNSDELTIPRYPRFLSEPLDLEKEKTKPNSHLIQLIIIPLIIVLVTVILIMIDRFEGRMPYFEK